MPAAHALQFISRHFNSALGLDDESAKDKAVTTLIDRLASGVLFASPKGLLLEHATLATDIGRWYSLWFVEANGRRTKLQPDIVNEGSDVVIPIEFWRPFQRSDDRALADWDAGDFRLDDVRDSDGIWLGRVRDVHFDRLELPSAWLAQAHDQTSVSDAFKGKLPPSATNSDRQHEVAAHEAAQVVREARCSLAEAIRRIRYLADPKGRSEDSIDRAIRRSYRLMYDGHGLPIKN
ncbi:MAG: hypothetical protein EOP84_18205 [Verrucomicrobiaceae bacterium]|nr:MAG: hypothetical protein EOP84_18205 [Verrucomicrobiaceae bacterium]